MNILGFLEYLVDRIFVAYYDITYTELLRQDPKVGNALFSCSFCTAIRTIVITSAVWVLGILLWRAGQ